MKFTSIYFKLANTHKTSVFCIELAIVENGKIKQTEVFNVEPTPNYFENRNKFLYEEETIEKAINITIKSAIPKISDLIKESELIIHCKSVSNPVISALEINNRKIYSLIEIAKQNRKHLVNYQIDTLFDTYCKKKERPLNNAEKIALITLEILKSKNANKLDDLEITLQSKTVSTLFEEVTDNNLKNKRISFFGEMTTLTRKNAQRMVEKVGGITKPENLSSKTNYLVIGQNDYGNYIKNLPEKTEKILSSSKDFAIISERLFLELMIFENSPHEVTLNQIEKDGKEFLARNKYNDLSGKNVFFSSDLSIDRLQAFQLVGNCSGFGHDYDFDVVSETDYFVISTKTIDLLKNKIKTKSILDFEHLKSKAQEKVEKDANFETFEFARKTYLLDETTFLEYMDKRTKFQKGEIKMNIYEWEINKKN